MNSKKCFPLLVAIFICAADCSASEQILRLVVDTLFHTMLVSAIFIFAAIVYFGTGALIVKWFGLFGLCFVIVFHYCLIPLLLFSLCC